MKRRKLRERLLLRSTEKIYRLKDFYEKRYVKPKCNVLCNHGDSYYISQPGIYRLGENLIVEKNRDAAIVIAGTDITFCLSGFSIIAKTVKIGILVHEGSKRVRILNGSIIGCTVAGIYSNEKLNNIFVDNILVDELKMLISQNDLIGGIIFSNDIGSSLITISNCKVLNAKKLFKDKFNSTIGIVCLNCKDSKIIGCKILSSDIDIGILGDSLTDIADCDTLDCINMKSCIQTYFSRTEPSELRTLNIIKNCKCNNNVFSKFGTVISGFGGVNLLIEDCKITQNIFPSDPDSNPVMISTGATESSIVRNCIIMQNQTKNKDGIMIGILLSTSDGSCIIENINFLANESVSKLICVNCETLLNPVRQSHVLIRNVISQGNIAKEYVGFTAESLFDDSVLLPISIEKCISSNNVMETGVSFDASYFTNSLISKCQCINEKMAFQFASNDGNRVTMKDNISLYNDVAFPVSPQPGLTLLNNTTVV